MSPGLCGRTAQGHRLPQASLPTGDFLRRMGFCRRNPPLIQRTGCVGHTYFRFEGNCDLRPAQSWAILAEAVARAAREPGEVDFLDQTSESLGLELGAAQPFFDPHDEDLVKSLGSQAIQSFTFWLSSHLAVLLFEWGSRPHILQVPAIWHNYR